MTRRFRAGDRVTKKDAPAWGREMTLVCTGSARGFWVVEKATPWSPSIEWHEDDMELIVRSGAACECGGHKLQTTHARWCRAHDDGGTAPFKQTKERLF